MGGYGGVAFSVESVTSRSRPKNTRSLHFYGKQDIGKNYTFLYVCT